MSTRELVELAGKTLLVVDDDEDLRETLVEEFRYHGATVLSAPDGNTAFELVLHNKVDGIVSDIRMPNGDGVSLLRRLKGHDPAMPVLLFITGHTDLTLEEAYNLGAEAVLAKPFDVDELNLAVRRMLTPKFIRWAAPPDVHRFTTRLVRRFASIEHAEHEGQLKLGRGGLYVRATDGVPGTGLGVTLDLGFDAGAVRNIEGCATTRWRRTQRVGEHEPGSGLEFEYLDTEASEQIAALVERLKITAYIPRP